MSEVCEAVLQSLTLGSVLLDSGPDSQISRLEWTDGSAASWGTPARGLQAGWFLYQIQELCPTTESRTTEVTFIRNNICKVQERTAPNFHYYAWSHNTHTYSNHKK